MRRERERIQSSVALSREFAHKVLTETGVKARFIQQHLSPSHLAQHAAEAIVVEILRGVLKKLKEQRSQQNNSK